MAEEIVTRFTADLSDLQAKVKTATATLEGYTEAADEAGDAVAAQGKKVGDLEAKTKTLVTAEKAVTAAVNQQTDAIEESRQAAAKVVFEANDLTDAEKRAAAAAGGITKEYEAMVAAAKKAPPPIREQLGLIQQIQSRITLLNQKKLSLTDPKEIARTNREIQQFEGRLRNLNRVGKTGGLGTLTTQARGLRGALTGAVDGLDSAGLSTGRLSGLVRGLASPLGAAVGLVGGLVYNFLQLDSAQVTIQGIKNGFGSMLAVLRNVNGGISQIIDGFREGMRDAETQDALNDAIAASKILSAEADRESSALIRQARDRSKDAEDRIALLEKANEIINKGSEEGLKNAKDQAELDTKKFVERLAQENTLGTFVEDAVKGVKTLDAETVKWLTKLTDVEGDVVNIDQELLDAAVNSSVAFIAADKARGDQIETNTARINTLREQGDAEQAQRNEKAEAERQKAFEAEKERIEKLSALRAKAAEERTDLENDALRRSTLGDDGQPTLSTATFDIEVQTQKAIDAESAAAAELTALVEANRDAAIAASRGNAKQQEIIAFESARQLEKIEQDKQDTIKLIRAKGEAEITAAQKQSFDKEIAAAKAATAAIEDALLTDDDRQLNAISKKYDELLKLTDKLTVNEAEKGRIRAQLLLARERELTEIIDEEGRKRLEIQVKLIEELGEGVGQALALLATSFSIGENDINAQFDQQLADLQEANQRELDEIAKRNGSQAELEEARNRATASYMDERNRIEQERGKELQENRERQEKEFLKLLIDTLEKVVQIYVAEVIVKQIADGAAQGGVPGALAGAAIGAAIAAIISGIFSALKSSIGGAYRGEEMIGGPAFFNGSRDTHLRRVHPKERIVSADKNMKHYDVLHAIHTDKFDQWKRANLMMEFPDMDHLVMPEINRSGREFLPNRSGHTDDTAIFTQSAGRPSTATPVGFARSPGRSRSCGSTSSRVITGSWNVMPWLVADCTVSGATVSTRAAAPPSGPSCPGVPRVSASCIARMPGARIPSSLVRRMFTGEGSGPLWLAGSTSRSGGTSRSCASALPQSPSGPSNPGPARLSRWKGSVGAGRRAWWGPM